MFESLSPRAAGALPLSSWLALLERPLGIDDDGEVVDQIAALERVKRACAARQARLSVAFDSSQRAKQRALGVRAERVGRGVGEQIGLARGESPSRGVRHLREAKALVQDMPHTLAALAAGDIDEWAAGLAVSATECLTAQDRGRVDAVLADRLPAMSPAQVRGAAWAAACRLDPGAVVKRNARAVNERRVWVRPAPDCMTYLTALLPVKQGVACFAALHAAAGAAAGAGDPRGRGQVMADTLVDRLTHPAAADPTNPTQLATATKSATAHDADDTIEICLVMTDTALLAGGDDPALVTSGLSGSNPAAGLVPAPVARDLVRDAGRVFVRRLYTDPRSGQLVAMESSRRVFDGLLRRMLVLRDGRCRTPWCDAPIRHADHVVAHADGGPTSLPNGQGLCERCNQTKTLPGWRAEVLDTVLDTGRDSPAGRHAVRTTTPTGHHDDSTAPPLLPGVRTRRQAPGVGSTRRPPGWRASRQHISPVETRMARRLMSHVQVEVAWHQPVGA